MLYGLAIYSCLWELIIRFALHVFEFLTVKYWSHGTNTLRLKTQTHRTRTLSPMCLHTVYLCSRLPTSICMYTQTSFYPPDARRNNNVIITSFWHNNDVIVMCPLPEEWNVISLSKHWGLNKMATVQLTAFSNVFYLTEYVVNSGSIFTEIRPLLVQIMTCRRTGDKRLPEPMMVWFVDSHAALTGLNELIVIPAHVFADWTTWFIVLFYFFCAMTCKEDLLNRKETSFLPLVRPG